MKTLALFLSIFAIGSAFGHERLAKDDEPLYKTSDTLYRRMIHFNPLALIGSGLEMAYETAVNGKESFLVNGTYFLSQRASILDLKDNYSNLNGFRVEIQYRFYKKDNYYINNLFIAPFLNIKSETADFHETIVNNGSSTTIKKITSQYATTLSGGVMLGSRKSIHDNIYLDAAFGASVNAPVDGEHHEELSVGALSPFQKSVTLKASFGLLIALH